MALAAGTRLGPYEISAQIGAGGMGEVYRARDTRLNRDVAVKILPQAFAEDADRLRRFEQEAQAAGSLNHPNIVAVYDFGREPGAYYVATELLDGDTLRARMASSPLPLRKALDYTIQTARGLAAAHAKGIAHRDIKPENLFVTNDGFVKILDFGLAKIATPSSTEKTSAPTVPLETDPGVVMGTAAYMSPEQVRRAPIDHRTDLFSLGLVLYEMLAGRRAFARDSSIETMSAILKEDPAELPDTAPPALARIVRRCLEKNPAERFESARDLAFALESISASGSGREVAVGSQASRAGWLRMAVFIGLTMAAAALTAWFLSSRKPPAAQLSFHRVTFRRGVIASAVFSNDGKTIVYSAAWDGKPYELFSTQETSPESRSLGIRNAWPVKVSRQGELALILSEDLRITETGGTLARMPVGGGAPREVAESILWADWSPDGSQFAVVRGTGDTQMVEYPLGHKLHTTGGFIGAMQVSPQGDLVAIIDSPLTSDGSGYIVVLDKDGNKKAVSRLFGNLFGMVWSPDGSEIWFSGAEPGAPPATLSLYGMDLKTHVRLIAALPGQFVISDVSSDGRLLLVQQSYSLSLRFHGRGAREETDLYWHDQSYLRDISPDGSQILFSEGGDASGADYETYVRKTDGSPAVRIGSGLAMAFSPDGKWAMLNPHRAPAQLMAFPLRAGEAHPLTSDVIHHVAGQWLLDGKRIVFVGSEPGHRLRYYVQDSPQSPPRAISAEPVPFDRNVDVIVISPDGRTVAAVTGRGIELLPVDSGAARQVPGMGPGYSPAAWCRDQSMLVYKAGGIPARMLRVNLETGRQQSWKELAPAERTSLYAIQPIRVAPDCETYGYSAQYQPGTAYVVSGVR